ncbi:MAG: hypothetical protein AAGF48_14090 [Pseudomonadota bacterium]
MAQSFAAVCVIAFGGAALNLMPVWLLELANKTGLGSIGSGLLASLLLATAAATCVLPRSPGLPIATVLSALVALVLALGATASHPAPEAVLLGAICVGGALGGQLSWALATAPNDDDVLSRFASGTAIGAMIAFVLLFVNAIASISALVLLGCLAIVPFAALSQTRSLARAARQTHAGGAVLAWAEAPFFISMGAYWAFLEIFATERGYGSLSVWLAWSLLASAAGAWVAGRLGCWASTGTTVALTLAAGGGGLTYLAPNTTVAGLAILVNAFGLFLFMPLYLGAGPATARLSSYLAGFALGGLSGGAVVAAAGYEGLAATVAVSGAIAIFTTRPGS